MKKLPRKGLPYWLGWIEQTKAWIATRPDEIEEDPWIEIEGLHIEDIADLADHSEVKVKENHRSNCYELILDITEVTTVAFISSERNWAYLPDDPA